MFTDLEPLRQGRMFQDPTCGILSLYGQRNSHRHRMQRTCVLRTVKVKTFQSIQLLVVASRNARILSLAKTASIEPLPSYRLYSGRLRAKQLLHQPVDSTSANTTEWIPHGGEQCVRAHQLVSHPDLEGHRHLADHTRNDPLLQRDARGL